MDDSYLNSVKREYYARALELIKSCQSDSWKLDDLVEEHIDRINRNPRVFTMYSKRSPSAFGRNYSSYPTICYIREVEDKIVQEIAPKLTAAFENNDFRKFEIHCRKPRIEVPAEGVGPHLKYINDPNYWNIYNIKFELKGGYSQDHERFWTILPDELSKL